MDRQAKSLHLGVLGTFLHRRFLHSLPVSLQARAVSVSAEHKDKTLVRLAMTTVVLVAMASALVAGPLGQVAGATTSVTLYAAPSGTATSDCSSSSADVCSIQGAIGEAETSTYDGDNVTVDLEHQNGSACSTSDECTFEPVTGDSFSVDDTNNGSLTIEGGGATDTILQGNSNSVLSDTASTPLFISDLEITGGGGTATSNGGGIDDTGSGALTITESTISDNTVVNATSSSSSRGGGIYDDSGALTITDSTISGNTATNGGGGGIADHSGTVTITDSTISDNAAPGGGGGGIYDGSNGSVTITDSTISGNTVTGVGSVGGGGIYDVSGAMTITGSTTISGNVASGSGGPGGLGAGIYDYNATVTMVDSTISGNTADESGGGIEDYDGGAVTIADSTVSGNTASSDESWEGGGISDSSGALTITDSTFSNNAAINGSGGGIYHGLDGSLTITDSTISKNSAGYSDGGIENASGTTTVTGSIVADNTTTSSTDNNCSGGFATASYDLSNGSTCGFGSGDDATLELGALGSYGGPTQTVPLLGAASTDQAIGFIPSTATATIGTTTVSLCGDSLAGDTTYGGADLSLDQRGDPRLPDGASSCDAGAYELQPATQLAFRTEPPTSSVADADFTVAVLVEDATGTLVSTSSAPVDLAITSGTGTVGATLSCATNPVDASSGTATFSCSINDPGTGYTLTATSSGLTSATSSPFAITAPPPSSRGHHHHNHGHHDHYRYQIRP